jgi:diguanylate cyclase (GGDEF)-like protein/PAS domain S-box-containing protein
MAASLERRNREREVVDRARVASEARYRAIVEDQTEWICRYRPDLTITFANEAFARHLGRRPFQLVGQSARDSIADVGDGGLAGRLSTLTTDDPIVRLEVPVTTPDGQPGWHVWRHRAIFDESSDLVEYQSVGHDVTERKRIEAQLAHQALRDALTGLPNRALFHDRLAQALTRAERFGSIVGVMFLDLDNFKVVNDSLGHACGDELLVKVTERLCTCLRADDTAARLGGDEFTILVDRLGDPDEAAAIAARVIEAMQAPFTIGERDVYITTSIGIAVSSPQCQTAEGLVRHADLAMYRAKANGKARYELFDASMTATIMERLELETDLRRAIDRGEFRLVYQPILALQTGHVVEYEALVRWEHPLRGLVSPNDFIPIAEETGLIRPIGQWVLEEACRQAMIWQRRSPTDVSPVMCVNLSVRQFRNPKLVQDISGVLDATGLASRCLKLEITESAVMEDVEATIDKLLELKALGIQLAIDDFGTGYSSLNYLKRLPVDTLKIDRSFVSGLGDDPQDAAIVRNVIGLARSLHLTVTAEGIETEDQLTQLRAFGCDNGQGYFFARPMAADAIDAAVSLDRAS